MLNYIWYIIQVLLQLVLPPKIKMSSSLNIFIKSNTGNTLSIDLDPKWDIRRLKENIAPKLGLSPEDVKIIFAGKELMDSIVIEVRFFFNAPV